MINPAVLSAEAATWSAYAAGAAALAAAVVAGIQLYVGHRQSKAELISAEAAMMEARSAGQRRIAEFRQAWIDNVINTLSEYVAELVNQWDSSDPKHLQAWKNTVALRVKLEVLLNPHESSTVALLKAADAVRDGHSTHERHAASTAVIKEARELLKREWVRIKEELAQ